MNHSILVSGGILIDADEAAMLFDQIYLLVKNALALQQGLI
jgi:hypothetical protein